MKRLLQKSLINLLFFTLLNINLFGSTSINKLGNRMCLNFFNYLISKNIIQYINLKKIIQLIPLVEYDTTIDRWLKIYNTMRLHTQCGYTYFTNIKSKT